MTIQQQKEDWTIIAKLFHDTYEELAPQYGYETREDTKHFDKNSANGKLMIEVCKRLFSQQKQQLKEELKKEIENYKPDQRKSFDDYIDDILSLINNL